MLARRLREQLEIQLDASLGELAALFARHRDEMRDRLPHLVQRRRWFEQVMDGSVSTLLRAGERAAAGDLVQDVLQRGPGAPRAGSVMLVGTGNGDPGLLTLKALRAMNQADLLLHEGVGADVLAMAWRDACRQPLPADDTLIELLGDHVRSGLRVVCLKLGDAFRTSPDDRLAPALAERGAACEVIAGVGYASST